MLYKGELSRYHIRPGRELGPKELEEIRALVIKRARLRAMKLLEISDRSESALRKKLTDSGVHGGDCGGRRLLCEILRIHR